MSQTSDFDRSVSRAISFAAQDESSKGRFSRPALQTLPYYVRKTTKISITCTYYQKFWAYGVGVLLNIKYYGIYVLLIMRNGKTEFEKGFQSGPPLLHVLSRNDCTVQQEVFVSKKFRQQRPSGSLSGIYFSQTSAVACLLFGRSVVALLLIVYLQIHESSWCHTCGFVEKFSQQFNLVKKILWRKPRS